MVYDLIKRDFAAGKPLEKCVTDMTEIKASDGKLYVSAIFDCYDLAVLGLAMDTNMKATLCEQTLDNAYKAYPMLRGAILHSDRGTHFSRGFPAAKSRFIKSSDLWASLSAFVMPLGLRFGL